MSRKPSWMLRCAPPGSDGPFPTMPGVMTLVDRVALHPTGVLEATGGWACGKRLANGPWSS